MPRTFPKFIKFSLIFAGLIFLIYLIANHNRGKGIEYIIYRAEKIITGKDPQAERAAQVSTTIQNTLRDKPGNYAIYVKDLKSDKLYEYKSAETFSAASIYKLALMYKTYDAVKNGDFAADTIVTGDQAELDKVLSGTNDEEPTIDQVNQADQSQQSETLAYPVSEALRLMITISDNYAALMLAQKLGWENVDTFLKNQGIQEFDLTADSGPQVSARAVGNLLGKIYKGQAVSLPASIEMKNLLLAQTVKDRIPKYLPADIKVAHKTGELATIRNDAGIIYGQNSDYIFVFLSDTPQPEDASETIANLSKQIYDTLEN